jgi:8-oxo-dGTP diphosphatase
MNSLTFQTLTFIFDNKSDLILLHQLVEDGPLKRKHSGIKGQIGLAEDMNNAAIRGVRESTGLELDSVVLRGIVKTFNPENQTSVVYLVYETSRFSGEPESKIPGRLKWVDILTVFNLRMEGLVREIMPFLLDGESFFEGTIRVNHRDEILDSEIRVCNSI